MSNRRNPPPDRLVFPGRCHHSHFSLQRSARLCAMPPDLGVGVMRSSALRYRSQALGPDKGEYSVPASRADPSRPFGGPASIPVRQQGRPSLCVTGFSGRGTQPEQHGRNMPCKPMNCTAFFRASRFDIRYSTALSCALKPRNTIACSVSACHVPFPRNEKLSDFSNKREYRCTKRAA